MVHQDHLDQELSQHALYITQMQVEGEISVQNQHHYMDQLINLNLKFHFHEFTSVDNHN